MISKRFVIFGVVTILAALLATFAACSPNVGDKDGSQASAEASAEAFAEYGEQSLYAYHASEQGEDITNITEVSVESCGQCHGDRAAIQGKTEKALVSGSSVANPHVNHMTKEFECSDCHSLSEASTLVCSQCHTWELAMDNGTWAKKDVSKDAPQDVS